MDVKPEKWRDPALYEAERLLTFRLYCDVHWTFGDNEPRQPNRRPQVTRILKPEIRAWLEEHNFPHKLRLGSDGRSKIRFDEKAHAALFKLVWM